MEFEEACRHAGRYIRDWEYADVRGRDALPKYMWFHIKGKKKTGYCTHCRISGIDLDEASKTPGWVAAAPYVDYEDAEHWETELELAGPAFPLRWNGENAMDGSARHGHFGRCPHCGMVVQYRNINLGHKSMRDRAFLIRYEESCIEPGTLVMLGWLVWTDWGRWDDYNESYPEINEELREICVFRPGEGGNRFVMGSWSSAEYDSETMQAVNIRRHSQWVHRKKCVGGFDPVPAIYYGPGTRFYRDEERFLNALDAVPYGDAIRRLNDNTTSTVLLDQIDLVHFVTRYPCMEYLEKLGLGGLVVAEYDGKRGELLNLRGKTAARVLRVDGDTWGWIKGHRDQVTANFLRIRAALCRRNVRIGNETVARIAGRWNAEQTRQILESAPAGQEKKIIRYLLKKNIMPYDYRDYLGQMDALRMAKTPDVLYPADFERMHFELGQRIKREGDRKLDKKIEKRLDRLGMYWFSALGLTLRPFMSSAEIIREGSLMGHCVGGYVNRYADGNTVILCLRRDEKLNEPWHTVEFSTAGRMIQCRGHHNRTKPDDQPLIDEFWKLFDVFRAEWGAQHNDKREKERKTA